MYYVYYDYNLNFSMNILISLGIGKINFAVKLYFKFFTFLLKLFLLFIMTRYYFDLVIYYPV